MSTKTKWARQVAGAFGRVMLRGRTRVAAPVSVDRRNEGKAVKVTYKRFGRPFVEFLFPQSGARVAPMEAP